MGDTKIKIDLSMGVIEAEGNEKFVKSIYSDFKEEIKAHPPRDELGSGAIRRRSPKKKAKKKQAKTPKTTKAKTGQQILGDLDLSKKGSTPSLKNFYQQYALKSYQEQNLLFCYYLQHLKKQAPITLNHIFTCYRNIKIKTPQHLYQSLVDTSTLKGWLNTRSMENISVKVAGLNYVEHEMPKKAGKE